MGPILNPALPRQLLPISTGAGLSQFYLLLSFPCPTTLPPWLSRCGLQPDSQLVLGWGGWSRGCRRREGSAAPSSGPGPAPGSASRHHRPTEHPQQLPSRWGEAPCPTPPHPILSCLVPSHVGLLKQGNPRHLLGADALAEPRGSCREPRSPPWHAGADGCSPRAQGPRAAHSSQGTCAELLLGLS